MTWGEQATPRWYFPTYGVLLAAWIASFDLGPTWVRVAATLVYVAALGAMVSAATTATGVSMPRLRGMPRRLRWACLAPVGLLVLALLGVFGWFELTDPEVSALLVGVVVGPAVALGGALATHGYRVVARRLADEAGLPR